MMRRRIPVLLASAGLSIAFLGPSPAHAATASGTLGTVSFSATAATLATTATTKLKGWKSTLLQATAVTVEGYGGTKSVSKSKATALGLARAKAVKAWMAANKVGGTVTVVNKVHAATAGSDKGNRVVVIVTKRNVTVTVKSDYDPAVEGSAVTCNVASTAVTATQGTTTVATASTSAAAGTCARKFTLRSVPTGKSTNLTVSLACNESGDGMAAEDVCFYAVPGAPWGKVTLADDLAVTGTTTLTGITVAATTGSVATVDIKLDVS